ncbi:hypothetical protein [Fulvivirga imtechensis]|uniref:hypothetical protein n=1 Tax=Fulvivirga imtechensis TaxID=881893 RepID=UPI00058B6C39|nr:hypothetical protein [Fulvivirga imtechensis]
MFTNFKYKNLPERHIQEVITYCLTLSSNDERNFNKWHVGLTEDSDFQADKIIPCDSETEASDLKRYLTTIRGFNDDGGNGKFLYVSKEKS